MNSIDWNGVFRDTLYIIITVWLPVIGVYVSKFLIAKREEVLAYIKDEKTRGYIDDALKTIEAAVIATNQTYVDTLKKEGKFDQESQNIAFEKSKQTALRMITEDAKKAITEVYGNIDTFLNTFIESYVKENKE